MTKKKLQWICEGMIEVAPVFDSDDSAVDAVQAVIVCKSILLSGGHCLFCFFAVMFPVADILCYILFGSQQMAWRRVE